MREPGVARELHSRRRLLAQEAARIMTCEGVSDYGAARRFWPTDEEILEAAHEWHRIYRFNQGKEHLDRLRRLACEAMEFLADFSPCLTGSVATAAAGEYAAITLDVFADTVEEVLRKLLDVQIPYTVHGGGGYGKRGGEMPMSEICFVVDGVTMELHVWPSPCRRQMPRKKESPRLTLREVRRLLEESGQD